MMLTRRGAVLTLCAAALTLTAACRQPSVHGSWAYGELSNVESSDPQRFPAEVLEGTFDQVQGQGGITVTPEGDIYDGPADSGDELEGQAGDGELAFSYFEERSIRGGFTDTLRFEGEYRSELDRIEGELIYTLEGSTESENDAGNEGGNGGRIDVRLTGELNLVRN